MYICLCKRVSDRDIRQGVLEGEVSCMESLRERLGATTGCGACWLAARQCLDEALAQKACSSAETPATWAREAAVTEDAVIPPLDGTAPVG